MADTLFILGAGVEKTTGINFPLAAQLLPEIVKFSETPEGIAVDTSLRAALPNLRFNLKSFIKSAVDNFNETTTAELSDIIANLQPIIDQNGTSSNKALLLKKLLETVKSVKDGSKIDNETFDLIKSVLGDAILEEIGDEAIISFKKLDFTDSFKVVIRHILRESVTNPSDPVGSILGNKILDFEKILIDTFLGFYLEKDTEIKKYLYVSWMLWAYLTYKNNLVSQTYPSDGLPFYSELAKVKDARVVTFNYTSFLEDAFGSDKTKLLYFHGYLREYIRLDNRDFFELEKTQLQDPLQFFNDNIKSEIDFVKKVYLIPGIIPPLRLKPVLSQEFIVRWYRASEWIKQAKKIIVIGYSFAYADEHFNDLIRKSGDKEIVIVNPNAEFLKNQISRLMGKLDSDFTKTTWQGKHTMYKAGKIKVIEAKADEIELSKL